MFNDNLGIVLNRGGACDVYLGCNIVSGSRAIFGRKPDNSHIVESKETYWCGI